MNNVKAHYNKEAVEYDKEFYQEPGYYPILQYRHNYILKRIAELNLPENVKILDIGCGPGQMIADLMQKRYELWGIDISEQMIDIAKRKCAINKPDSAVHFAVGNIEGLEFEDNFFDVIICSGVVEYLKDDSRWIKELLRVLKPGGVLLINITNKYAIGNWTIGAFNILKNVKLIFNGLNFIKESIFRKGRLHYFPFQPRQHSPIGFDHFLREAGFSKIAHNYFGFSLLPYPLDTIVSFITLPIRKRMERFSQFNMILFGMGYLVTAKLRNRKIL
jgi:ubiquinone/menaquinone biosynthesis C-methylase UbiE